MVGIGGDALSVMKQLQELSLTSDRDNRILRVMPVSVTRMQNCNQNYHYCLALPLLDVFRTTRGWRGGGPDLS